jgi:hypothetical protein
MTEVVVVVVPLIAFPSHMETGQLELEISLQNRGGRYQLPNLFHRALGYEHLFPS